MLRRYHEIAEKKEVENVEKYHIGRGWYKLPWIEKNLRKSDAINQLNKKSG